MHNKIVLKYLKDEDTKEKNKYRWSVTVDKVRFLLYIPKWRVPKLIPRRVCVVIYHPGDELPVFSQLKCSDAASSPERLQSPIVSKVRLHSEHINTIRYDPIGDPKDLEIGSPYIPKKLLPKEHPSELTISVEWLAG